MVQGIIFPSWVGLLQKQSLGLVASNGRRIKSGTEYDHFFPKADNKTVIINDDASVEDTIALIKKMVKQYSPQVAQLAKHLEGKNVYETCKNIFDFCYQYINYRLDDEGTEQLHTPARIWQLRKRGIDCDDYAFLISCLLTNLQIPHTLRLAEYAHKGYFQHIYVIVKMGKGQYITLDPVKDNFNEEHNTADMPLTGKEDINMRLMMLSGLGEVSYSQIAYANAVDKLSDTQRAGLKKFLISKDANFQTLFEQASNEADALDSGDNQAVLTSYERDILGSQQAYELVKKENVQLEQLATFSESQSQKKTWWQKHGTKVIIGGTAVFALAWLISFNKNDNEGTQGVSGVGGKPKKKNKGKRNSKSKPVYGHTLK